MIKVTVGDVTKAKEKIIAYVTNCKGQTTYGLSKQIKNVYPKSFIQLRKLIDEGIRVQGLTQVCFEENGKIICHLFAQRNEFADTNLNQLQTAFEDLAFYARSTGYSIAMPYRVGCSDGRADWNVVYKMIKDNFKDCKVTLYRLEK